MKKAELVFLFLLPFVVVGSFEYFVKNQETLARSLQARHNEQQAAWYNCLEGVPMRAYYSVTLYVEFECVPRGKSVARGASAPKGRLVE